MSELASTKTVAHTIAFEPTGGRTVAIGTWSVTGTAFPVSGFQNILSNSEYSIAQADSVGYRMNYLIAADSSISGTTPYYIADNGGLTTTNMILVFRPNTTPSSVTINSLNNYADAGVLTNPANQTITSGAGTAPLVALALYEQIAGSITTRSFSPAADGEVTSGTSRFVKYKIYNSSPADITVGMTSTTGTARGLASYYLQFNGTSSVTFVGSSITGVVPTVQAGDIVVSHIIMGDANTATPITVPVSPTNGVGVFSSTAGTRRTLDITNATSGIDYLSVKDIGVSTIDKFYVGANSTDYGNNLNVYFTGGATTYFGTGTVNGLVTTTANASAIYSSNASINANSFVTVDASAIYSSNASINANSLVSCNGSLVAIINASGQITGYANVSANANKITNSSASVNGIANVTALGGFLLSSNASITSNATVIANATKTLIGLADVNALVSVSASSNAEYSGIGSINALATIDGYANANYSANGAINCTANLAVLSLGNTWNNVAVGTNTWSETNGSLYVFDGYWVDGYVVTSSTWSDVATTSNTWYRQG
jgi:hypothetical protein